MLKTKKLVPVAGFATVALAAVLGLTACGGDTASTTEGSEPSGEATQTGMTMDEGKIVFATSPDYPPFENLEDGEYVGLDMDLGRAIADYLGLECKYVNIDFDGIIPAIVAGGKADAGLSGLSITPEREKEIKFTDSYYTDNQAVATLSDNADITKDNATDALNAKGVTIAVQSGSTGADFAKENFPNAKKLPFPNFTDAFAAVNSGKADAVCGNYAVVNQMLAGAYTNLHTVLTSATGEEYAIAVNKDNDALLKALNEAIAALKKDGTIDDLIDSNMGASK